MNRQVFIPELSLPLLQHLCFNFPELVIEGKNGIVGTFPALNQRTSEGFEEVYSNKNIAKTMEEETGKKAAPFGVNLIVHPTNPRVEADVKLCVKHRVPLVTTFWVLLKWL